MLSSACWPHHAQPWWWRRGVLPFTSKEILLLREVVSRTLLLSRGCPSSGSSFLREKVLHLSMKR